MEKIKIILALMMTIIMVAAAGCQQSSIKDKTWNSVSAKMKMLQAKELFRNGNFEEARKNVQVCLMDDPQNTQANLLYGQIFLAMDQFEKAVEHINIALNNDPKLAEGWYFLGIAYQTRRDNNKAEMYFRNALDLEPQNIEFLLVLIDTMATENRCNEAIAIIDEKSDLVSEDSRIVETKADLFRRLGEYQKAIEFYGLAIELDKSDLSIREQLGYCYMITKQFGQAADIFAALGELSSEPRQKSHFNKMYGIACLRAERFTKAVDVFNKMAEDNRDDVDLWIKLGQAYLGLKLTDDTLSCASRAMRISPDSIEAMALSGSAYFMKNDYESAKNCFAKITAIDSENSFAWLMKAKCCEKLGLITDAREAFKTAAQISSGKLSKQTEQ
ncbi:MAG: tetratricopeptide repeat protein, partial [Phycisphaerae bacterium]|nr:tetratricopeptide repeat protein [Phycisphaerae bacterium]